MSYIDGSINDYVKEAGAGKPTPGGGSVSALVGALGVTMAQMAANFTTGKKKFRAVEPKVQQMLNELAAGLGALLEEVDKDAEAYATVAAAYGMPHGTAVEKKGRSEAIQEALHVAMKPPRDVCRQCYQMLKVVNALKDVANPQLVSDVAVSAIMLQAALKGAKLNVMINLAALKDQDLVDRLKEEIDELENLGRIACEETVTFVEEAISGAN